MPAILGNGFFNTIAVIFLAFVLPLMLAWCGRDIMNDEHATGGTRDKGNMFNKIGIIWIVIEVVDAIYEWLA